jgi:type IV pilus assembly protein PilZ
MKKLFAEYVSDRELYVSYMPFIENGGLFIRTAEEIELGTEVSMSIILPDALEEVVVKGVVSWHTPIGVQSGTPPGVGISFTDDPDKLRFQIETAIARHLNSSEPTLTM